MNRIKNKDKVLERFARYIVIDLIDCWGWTGSVAASGYGQLQIRSECQAPICAHRLSWMLFRGDIPNGKHVLHVCDNRICTNPNHLFLGDQRANNRDRDRKGRTASGDRNGSRTHYHQNSFVRHGGSGLRGQQHPMAKLKKADIASIIGFFNKGMRKSEIARRFDVSQTHIGRIINGTVWRDV